jgi:hypothetical protein
LRALLRSTILVTWAVIGVAKSVRGFEEAR